MIASFWLWLISDIRNWIIIGLVILLAGIGSYCVVLKWQVADKDSKISTYKSENDRLTLNNTNLTAQNDQLKKASDALQKYVSDILKIKADTQKIRDSIASMKGKEDEIENNNLIADSFNNRKP